MELVLTNSAPFVLSSFDISNDVNIYNSKGVNQDGANYLGNTLDIKDISLEVAIMSNNFEEAANYRNLFNKVFNPKIGEGYLVYKDELKERKIKCVINKLPYFDKDSDATLQTCLISLTANYPFWNDLLESKEEIALWKGDFSFPLKITSAGIKFGHREPSLIVNVLNTGDVECGMRVEFKALATLTNPSILNVNNQEYIKINKTMVAGEVIAVSTYLGSKKITSTLNGVVSNAFNYIDFQSTFLQLDVGDNLFRYNADTNLDNLEVSIYYQPQYLGV
ncbi:MULTISPECIES: phage tail family protein [Clostridium]|uniref:Phage tail family protein n=1 Tax=Clostridium frigoriphilum TaxID=443253 RepID=A0ABU7UHN1_9CLOT